MANFPKSPPSIGRSTGLQGPTGATGAGGAPPGWFMPETYGAIGDGTTDDSLALNACLAAANTYGSSIGSSVLLSKQYAHAAPLMVGGVSSGTRGLRIMGTGGTLQWSDGPTLFFTGGQGTGQIATLGAAVATTGVTTITTTAAAPAYLGAGNFQIQIDSETLWVYSGANTTTWTVRRGFLGTTAATHLNSTPVLPQYGALLCWSVAGLTLQNFRVSYTSPAFTGDLVNFDWGPPFFGDPTNWEIKGCAFRGTPNPSLAQGARSLLRLNHTIIGKIAGNHFGEGSGPAIRCGDGNYCVGVEISGQNTFNSGIGGTWAVETTGGCEAIHIHNNTFEPRAGTYSGAWRHNNTNGAVGFGLHFDHNWMGDESDDTNGWVTVLGTLQGFSINQNRFNAGGGGSPVLIDASTGILTQGTIFGNYVASNNSIVALGSTASVSIFNNHPTLNVTRVGSVGGLIEDSATGFLLRAGTANPSLGLGGTATPKYTFDVNEVSGVTGGTKGIRLLGGTLWFGGTTGNNDAVQQLGPQNLIGMRLVAGSGNTNGLAFKSSSTAPAAANLPAGDGGIFVFDDGSGTLRWQLITKGSSANTTGFVGDYLTATATWNPPSVGSGAITTTTVNVTNAVVGQAVSVGFPLLVGAAAAGTGLQLAAQVTAAGVVTVVLRNDNAGAIDLDSGTLRVLVWQH